MLYLELMHDFTFQCTNLQKPARGNSNQNFGHFRRGTNWFSYKQKKSFAMSNCD